MSGHLSLLTNCGFSGTLQVLAKNDNTKLYLKLNIVILYYACLVENKNLVSCAVPHNPNNIVVR